MNRNKEFTQKINELVESKIIPGASWSFVSEKNSENYYAGAFGVTEEYEQKRIDESAIYDIASLTKVIGTTTRIIQLIDKNLLGLDTKVSEILLEYSNLNCTIKQLLTHTSGLEGDFPDKSDFSWEKVKNYLLNSSLDTTENATVYSDIGFLLLGLVIEKIDECSLEDSFQENIFKKLKMNQTSFVVRSISEVVPTEIQQEEVIVGIVHDSKARQLKRPVGSAGLFTTLADLVLFTQGLMTNTLADGNPMFSEKSFNLLKSISVHQRSLGWELLDVSHVVLFHTGFTGTAIGINLEKQESLILLTNRIHPTRNNQIFINERKIAYTKYFL